MDEAERRAIAEAEAAELSGAGAATDDATTVDASEGAGDRITWLASPVNDRYPAPPFRSRIGGFFFFLDLRVSGMPESLPY